MESILFSRIDVENLPFPTWHSEENKNIKHLLS